MQKGSLDENLLDTVLSFLGNDRETEISYKREVTTAISESSPVLIKLEEKKERPSYHVVIFTKNRPWQLQQLLQSMKLKKGDTIIPYITIIANIQPEFKDGYEVVFHEFEEFITILEESTEQTFSSLLRILITKEKNSKKKLRWMFLTDDCFLLVPVSEILLKSASSISEGEEEFSIFISRLHPGISWCQTRGIPSPLSPSNLKYCPKSETFSYFLQSGGVEVDWAYPWDLSGGIYGNNLVQDLMSQLNDEASVSNPNRLEMAGYEILRGKKSLKISILSFPALLILTINRVQNVCKAPVDCQEYNLIDLLQYLDSRMCLDIESYQNLHFNSSHIEKVILIQGEETTTCNEKSDITVLLPVRTGPPEFAKNAIRSIVMQAAEESSPIQRMQILVVDDHCTDGSIDAIIDSAKTAAQDIQRDITIIRDGKTLLYSEGFLMIEIIQSSKGGIAAALNIGLKQAKSEFIARMDADDICAAKRFAQQLRFMKGNPSLAVLGMQSVVFWEGSNSHPSSNESKIIEGLLPFPVSSTSTKTFTARPALYSADPGFTAWSMLFSCTISHPSVMYRKSVILEAGGYDEDNYFAEDYSLWLRLVRQDPRSLSSRASIGVWHRKHRKHSPNKKKQTQESNRISFQAILSYVKKDVDIDVCKYLRDPDSAINQNDLDSATELLVHLFDEFLLCHRDNLTNREIELIGYDFKERLGEIATLSITQFYDNAAAAWRLWCKLCPEKSCLQVALLCHSRSSSKELNRN